MQAARALGAGGLRMILRHILPNIASALLVQATVSIPAAIIAEAILSFLGLGVQPPTPELGHDARHRPAVPGDGPVDVVVAGPGHLLARRSRSTWRATASATCWTRRTTSPSPLWGEGRVGTGWWRGG